MILSVSSRVVKRINSRMLMTSSLSSADMVVKRYTVALFAMTALALHV